MLKKKVNPKPARQLTDEEKKIRNKNILKMLGGFRKIRNQM